MKIAFYKGRKRLFNRLVSWWTRGPYSHTELVCETEPGSGVYHCLSSSFMDGGVRLKRMALDQEHWDLVDVDGDWDAAVDWFQGHIRCKYDVLGLVGFVFRRVPDARDRYFCSEAVAASLGYPESWRLDPNTLYAVVTREVPDGSEAAA